MAASKSVSRPGALKRTGLHRAECEHECGAYVYATVAMLERHGCPVCACGGRLIPDHPDLAAAVLPDASLDAHPAVLAYHRELARVMHGRAPREQRIGSHTARTQARSADAALSAEDLASQRVEQARREAAHARRMSGLRRPVHVDPMPF